MDAHFPDALATPSDNTEDAHGLNPRVLAASFGSSTSPTIPT